MEILGLTLHELFRQDRSTKQEAKDDLRATIQAQVDEFLARGNEITVVDSSEMVGRTLRQNDYWSKVQEMKNEKNLFKERAATDADGVVE